MEHVHSEYGNHEVYMFLVLHVLLFM